MTVQVKGQELVLSGTVGAEWFEDSFTHGDVVAALARLEGDITVRINSGGGIASEGAAIYSTLTTYDGAVSVVVEGIAASAASLIAMAGDTITMAAGALMMIHDPLNITFGDSAAHAKTIEELEAYAISYARIYAKRAGISVDEARAIMREVTWMDGEAAVAAGFADNSSADKAKPVAAYDYRTYAKAPSKLVARARAQNWSFPPPTTPTSASAEEDHSMNDKERADALALELATANAAKDAAVTELAALKSTATTEAVTAAEAAVKADRDRRVAIMALPEAKGREALAEVLFTDGATAEKAKSFLAAAPVAQLAIEGYTPPLAAGAVLNGGGNADPAKPAWAKAVARANKNLKK